MHGQPRKAPKPEDEAASLAKAEKLRALQSQFLSYHHNNVYIFSLFFSFSIPAIQTLPIALLIFNFVFIFYKNCFSYTKEALEVNAKLLEINPEYYTAWNYRKLSVEHRLSQSESDLASVKSILSEELKVVCLF